MIFADFGKPRGSLLGILSAMIPLGAICATPFISMVGDRHGRKKGIFLGSLIMAIGGLIQGSSVHSKFVNVHTPHSYSALVD